ncbi:MAG: PilZ domain-containing protein [Sphingomonadaceae bacterium]|jgi:hypothetical protein|nr:PilZ domain-containing protein [Sphingomonadaceae bacterium]
MSAIDTRHISRDSLFLLADVKVGGEVSPDRVKVRNLSGGGMMAEGGPRVERGANVAVNLRNIGWVDGTVAWVQDSRFGIAFGCEIDPKLARAPEGKPSTFETPRFARPSSILPPGADVDRIKLRNI